MTTMTMMNGRTSCNTVLRRNGRMDNNKNTTWRTDEVVSMRARKVFCFSCENERDCDHEYEERLNSSLLSSSTTSSTTSSSSSSTEKSKSKSDFNAGDVEITVAEGKNNNNNSLRMMSTVFFTGAMTTAATSGFDLEGPESVIQAISVLATIIFVHESGHFLAARTQGIHVNKFAVGFGPNIWSYQGKEVLYALKAIPLGGFVAFPDDDEDCPYPPDDPDLLRNRPVRDRAIVVSAGIIANCLFGFAILLAQANTIGLTYAKYAPGVIVKGFVSPSAAEKAGFKRGDIILRIDGEELEADAKTVSQVVNKIKASPNKKLDVVVDRNGEMLKLNLIPDETPKTLEGRVGTRLEANSMLYKKLAKNPSDSIALASREFGRLFSLVGKSLTGLVTNFSQSKDQVSGPLAIIAVGSEVVRKDISGLYQFGAVININLAIVNLLPLPALDGGFLLLLVIEAIRGKKMQKETEQSITGAGVLFLLISGGVLVTRDIADFVVKAFGLDL